jgi:hypothetical protein
MFLLLPYSYRNHHRAYRSILYSIETEIHTVSISPGLKLLSLDSSHFIQTRVRIILFCTFIFFLPKIHTKRLKYSERLYITIKKNDKNNKYKLKYNNDKHIHHVFLLIIHTKSQSLHFLQELFKATFVI